MCFTPGRSSAMLGSLVLILLTACTDNDGPDPTAPSPEGITEPARLSAVSASNSWTLRRSMPLPARFSSKAATLNGIIYVVGGEEDNQSIRDVDAYNIASNTWSSRRSLPAATNMNGVSVIDGKLYVVGGIRQTADGRTLSRSLFVYNPKFDSWTRKRDLPVDAFHGTQAVINGKLYVHVGSISLGVDSVFFRYDPATNTWIKRASPPNQHIQGQARAINGKLYLVGGEGSPNLEPTTRLDVYNPATNTWTRKASMLQRRMAFASGVINGKLYVAGGWDSGEGSTLNSTEVYDPATNTWSSKAVMPNPQLYMASAAGGNRLFVIGGDDGLGPTRKVQAFRP